MKNLLKSTMRSITIIAFVVMFGFCFVACGGGQNNLTEDCFEPINSEGKKVTIAEATAYRIIKGKSTLPAVVHISAKYNGKPVTEIGAAFRDLKHITTINIPNSVTKIGANAFRGCENLTNITIPKNVTSIGNDAFRNCKSLTKITIPAGVTVIGSSTFRDCIKLTNVTIPEGVTSIGQDAFSFCKSLAKVTLPASITKLEYGAFYNCTNLANINIPNGVSIGSNAFKGTNLTSIIIPDNVRIENGAFDCTNLTSVTFQGILNPGEKINVPATGDYFYQNGDIHANSFYGDLFDKYIAGGIGTYTTTAPVQYDVSVWTKQ